MESKFPLPSEGLFKPASDAQTAWLNSRAELLLGGGSAGSLKTSTAIIDGSVEYDNSNMHTIMFRPTLQEHEEALKISREWFSQAGATFSENEPVLDSSGRFNGNAHIWRWPWGSSFKFAYCSKDEDVYQHQSQSYTCELWDESTLTASEFMVRYLLTRLRSTDSSLFLRSRLGTNPGGKYADWQMRMFLGGACPHCEPTVRVPGRIYTDATWPSDNGDLGGMRTQFIFSRVTDHNLLGETYVRNIRMQHPAIAEALLAGCWKAFVGQYFDIWNPGPPKKVGDLVLPQMVVKRQDIKDRWFWEHWVGADYGFSGSSAVGYLMARDPDTRKMYFLDEYVSKRESVRDWARSIYERFAKKQSDQEQSRKLRIMYLSPDAWNDRGDQHTLAGQMNEVLFPHGLAFVRARNDRAGGSQLLYELLKSGQLAVADTCDLLISGIVSAEHDKAQPEAYVNVPGDPRADARDAARYAVYSYHMEAMKPLDVRIKERVDEQLATSDMTAAMFQSAQIRKEEEQRGKPQAYARRGSMLRNQVRDWERKRR